jgi:hypothetical protein
MAQTVLARDAPRDTIADLLSMDEARRARRDDLRS